jgi:hypothetical protein
MVRWALAVDLGGGLEVGDLEIRRLYVILIFLDDV